MALGKTDKHRDKDRRPTERKKICEHSFLSIPVWWYRVMPFFDGGVVLSLPPIIPSSRVIINEDLTGLEKKSPEIVRAMK